MDRTVAFLGQKSIDIDTGIALARLGALLAEAGAELHTSQMDGSNASVARGYREGGKEPVFHTSKLHESSPWFILYGDEAFHDGILLNWPNPDDTRGWFAIYGPVELDAYISRLARALKSARTG